MIEIIDINDSNKWNSIVKSQKNYDVFYMSEYAKAFQLQGVGEPILIHVFDSDNSAISVMFKRDISECEYFKGFIKENTYFDLCSPYGYGGFVSDTLIKEKMLDEYEKFCVQNDYVCEFVRFGLFSDYHKHYRGEVETRTHNVVRNLNMTLDDMFMDFEHKVRKNIKHAQRENLRILIEKTDEHLDDFLKIYYNTMDRNSANNSFYFTRDFFDVINTMKDNYVYVYVIFEDKVISAELIIYGSENAYSYLGGTDSKYFSLRPNDFLKYEAIKWLKDNGIKNFVLGGGYGADDGIFKYKKSFSPNGVVDFYIGRQIFNPEVYDMLLRIREKENGELDKKFFPLYRAPSI